MKAAASKIEGQKKRTRATEEDTSLVAARNLSNGNPDGNGNGKRTKKKSKKFDKRRACESNPDQQGSDS